MGFFLKYVMLCARACVLVCAYVRVRVCSFVCICVCVCVRARVCPNCMRACASRCTSIYLLYVCVYVGV